MSQIILPFRYYPAQGSELWTPDNLATAPVGWLDADDASTLTLVGNDVSAWTSKGSLTTSANQSTSSQRPVYNATSFNGKPGIRFDTTNSELLKLTNLMFSDPNEIYCITAINRDLAIGNGNGLWFGHRSEGTRLIQFSGVTAADEILMQLRGSGASLVQVSGAPTGGAEYVGEYQFDVTGSDTFVRVNAGTKTSDTTNFGTQTFTSTIQIIGGFNNGGGDIAAFNGFLAEAVFLNYKPTATEVEKLQGYMHWKWGLEGDLPPGHPYKSAAPTV